MQKIGKKKQFYHFLDQGPLQYGGCLRLNFAGLPLPSVSHCLPALGASRVELNNFPTRSEHDFETVYSPAVCLCVCVFMCSIFSASVHVYVYVCVTEQCVCDCEQYNPR